MMTQLRLKRVFSRPVTLKKLTTILAIIYLMTVAVVMVCWSRADAVMQCAEAEPKPTELYEIMSKQYDVPYGEFLGARYKKILYWNSFKSLHAEQEYGMGIGPDGFRLAGCPVWQCETSQNRSNLLEYDAVLFHSRNWNGNDLPHLRSSHQRYIYFAKEAPAWDVDEAVYANMGGLFNWTMTYRWDSDVVHPYGWFEPKGSIPLHPTEEEMSNLLAEAHLVNYAASKTKMAAWFISNCRSMSGRDDMVDRLSELIQVDRYGSCGNLTCGNADTHARPGEDDEMCREMAARTYKFYLALENSLCVDYASERFFATLRYPVIPIVMDAHGTHAKLAPPHSYINALDFPSVDHLAQYLILLDQNDRLYNEYFWWKDHFEIRNGVLYSGLHHKTFCSLCAALHDPDKYSNQQHPTGYSYPDLKSWWYDGSQCKSAVYSGMRHELGSVRCSPDRVCNAV